MATPGSQGRIRTIKRAIRPQAVPIFLALQASLLALWRFVGNLGNIEFLLSISSSRVAMMFKNLFDYGWLVLLVTSVVWALFIHHQLKVPAKGQRRIVQPSHQRAQQGASGHNGWIGAVGIACLVIGITFTASVVDTSTHPTLEGWGRTPVGCFARVSTERLLIFRGDYDLITVCTFEDPLIDNVNEPVRAISNRFNIHSGSIYIPANFRQEVFMLPEPQYINIFSAIISSGNDFALSEIKTISDLARLGGKIVGSAGAGSVTP